MVEAEILLDFSHNLTQHVHGIVAGDGHPRNVVEESQLLRPAFFLSEQAGILNRHRDLAGGCEQHIEVALFEDIFAFQTHSGH